MLLGNNNNGWILSCTNSCNCMYGLCNIDTKKIKKNETRYKNIFSEKVRAMVVQKVREQGIGDTIIFLHVY